MVIFRIKEKDRKLTRFERDNKIITTNDGYVLLGYGLPIAECKRLNKCLSLSS